MRTVFEMPEATSTSVAAWFTDIAGSRVHIVVDTNSGVLRVFNEAWELEAELDSGGYLEALSTRSIRACFERLADGTADNNDFYRVAMALNLAKVRALEIDQALANLLEVGQDAMAAIRRRHDKWAKWEVLPAERTAIVEALDAHEAITDASSPLQMMAALDVVRRVIRKQARQP